ncbi:hypothetical protein COCNU_01G013550 [Cocos nucifera]|uniref:SAWADEE domain-containing protein n=1 Tax=Cocos nucifera TaxID=13894 RepID=A0A8K0HVK8_COCNU|nr:hypothetical protein COCNU_01G013550 [Cocos nucifera]
MGWGKRRLRKHTNIPGKATLVTASSSRSNVLDFRAPSDDGWYGVQVAMDSEEKLRVIYMGFSNEYDELYAIDSFKDEQEINEFASRFRPISLQLQDSDCNEVIEGMHVCASLQPSDEELRFYDASVDSAD